MSEVLFELRQMVWPNRKEMYAQSVVVLALITVVCLMALLANAAAGAVYRLLGIG